MNARLPTGVLHSFSIKNIFYGQMDLRKAFLFSLDNILQVYIKTVIKVNKMCFKYTSFVKMI